MIKYSTLPKGFFIKYGIIASFIILFFVLPESLFYNHDITLCIHKRILGFQCPLCGMTRAVYEMVHLNIFNSLKFNIAVIFLPVYIVLDFIDHFSRRISMIYAKRIVLLMFLISLIMLYLIRFLRFI